MRYSNDLHPFKAYGSIAQFAVLNGTSKLLIRVWSPFCYYHVGAGGVSMRIITKTIRLRVRASLMNKGRARSGAFGLVSAPGSALGRKAVGIRAAVGGRTVTNKWCARSCGCSRSDACAVLAARVCVCVCVGRYIGRIRKMAAVRSRVRSEVKVSVR